MREKGLNRRDKSKERRRGRRGGREKKREKRENRGERREEKIKELEKKYNILARVNHCKKRVSCRIVSLYYIE
jgi:hypothetical protein